MSEKVSDTTLRYYVANRHAEDDAAKMARELIELRAKVGWRDIATAPKDGTPVLVYLAEELRKSRIEIATFHSNGIGVIGNLFHFDAPTPTHWMPLPPVPTSEKAG